MKVRILLCACATLSILLAGMAAAPPARAASSQPAQVGVSAVAPTVSSATPGSSVLYVADFKSNKVSVIDASSSTPSVTGTISVGSEPIGVAASGDGSRVYVGEYGTGHMAVIDTSSNTVATDPFVGANPLSIAVDNQLHKAFVSLNYQAGAVAVFSTVSNTQVGAVTIGSGIDLTDPSGVVVSPDGSTVYATNEYASGGYAGGTGLFYFSAANPPVPPAAASSFLANLGSTPKGVAIDPSGSTLYVANAGDNTVSIINFATCCPLFNPAPTVSVGSEPLQVAVSPDGKHVYVANSGGNTISVIDTATDAVSSVTVGTTPYGIAVSSDGTRVFVANADSDTVSVIDTTVTPNKVINTISLPTGSYPQGIVAIPHTSSTGTGGESVSTAVSTQQYTLTGSDGTTWQDMDAGTLVKTVAPSVSSDAFLSANADLWTSSAGYNQDIAIWVSGGAYGSGQVVAWKESGGFAGTYSPNAAFVHAVVPMPSGATYTVKIQWKANKPDPGSIWAGAGPIGSAYSPTRLTVELESDPSQVWTAFSTQQYTLTNSDGATWQDVDSTDLSLPVTPASSCDAVLSANADLWTSSPGYNQDIAIRVSGGAYGSGQIVAWKESGGFAGTFSPNAAFVHAIIPLAGGTAYTLKVQWKTNKPDPGTIFIGAGPLGGHFSPTRLSLHCLTSSTDDWVWTSYQYWLSGSDGVTWTDVDSTNFTRTITPGANVTAILSGNADLWTDTAGYNQDIAIWVSGGIYGSGQVVAWKESGGFAGTYSPNAAFIQAVIPMSAGIAYRVKLKWKTNKPDPNRVYIGAGGSAPYSRTWLTTQMVPSG